MGSLLGQIPSTTQAAFLKKLADDVFGGNPFFKMMTKGGELVEFDGGENIRCPIITGKSNGGPYSRMETLVAPDSGNIDSARFDWKQFYASEGLDGLALAQNDGIEKQIDIWGAKLESIKMTLADALATSYSTVSGSGLSTDLTLLEEIVGAGTKEIGSLTSTEVPTWAGAAQDSTGAALTYALLLNTYMDASEDMIHPNILLTSKAGYAVVDAIFQQNQRYLGSDEKFGFENLKFKDSLVVFDSHVSDGSGTVTGSSDNAAGDAYTGLRILYLNTDFLKFVAHRDNFFRVKEVEPDYQDGKVAFVFLYGNIICNNRRFQAVRHNFT